ncbi:hypothetical protein HC766_07110 [Candidatus Gracilibacteria bacterium]|nr:hypothetical protein [Candidatus Gracilibacteria bacterium]
MKEEGRRMRKEGRRKKEERESDRATSGQFLNWLFLGGRRCLISRGLGSLGREGDRISQESDSWF